MGREEPVHEGNGVGRVLLQASLCHHVAVLRHRDRECGGVGAGRLHPEDDPTLADVAGKDRFEVVEGQVQVDQLEPAGARPATLAPGPTSTATSTSTAGAVQPVSGTVAQSGVTPVSVR